MSGKCRPDEFSIGGFVARCGQDGTYSDALLYGLVRREI